jgi:hypothetical protein
MLFPISCMEFLLNKALSRPQLLKERVATALFFFSNTPHEARVRKRRASALKQTASSLIIHTSLSSRSHLLS